MHSQVIIPKDKTQFPPLDVTNDNMLNYHGNGANCITTFVPTPTACVIVIDNRLQ